MSAAEAELYQAWIANRRRAEAVLDELEELSAQAAESILGRAAERSPRPARRAEKRAQ